MSDRYTSPETSRALAEAGLGDHASWGMSHRLDLTDVLREIETRGATWLVETDGGTYCATAVLNPKFSAVMGGPSAAEAAGLCLLALLDKEREVKA